MAGCFARPNKLSHPWIHHFFLRLGSWLTQQPLSDPTHSPVGKAGAQMLIQLLPMMLATSEGCPLQEHGARGRNSLSPITQGWQGWAQTHTQV